jgi:hypothetical protein
VPGATAASPKLLDRIARNAAAALAASNALASGERLAESRTGHRAANSRACSTVTCLGSTLK